MSVWVFLFVACSLLANVLARGDVQVCAFANEGAPATLSCPEGFVIKSVVQSTFGIFEGGSSCETGLHPGPQCPTTVQAQADLLCMQRASCSISCQCNPLDHPPCQCSLAARNLSIGVPAWPCAGVPKSLGLIASCGPLLPPLSPAAATAKPTELRLEFMESPVLGLDNLKPQFTWVPPQPVSGSRLPPAEVQSAFRVNISVAGAAGVIWTSGVVRSRVPTYTVTEMLPLLSDQAYEWRVETWSGTNSFAVSDGVATFTTGLLAQQDWGGALWIDAGRCEEGHPGGGWHGVGTCIGGLLRKEFLVAAGLAKIVRRASLFVSACQYYELYLDGARVGDHQLDVVWTRFNRNRSYSTYDLDPSLFTPGKHVLGLMVGQGFCGETAEGANETGTRAALLKLTLHSGSGEPTMIASDDAVPLTTVVSDGSWEFGQSPLIWESAYYGEIYISELEQPGWNTAKFAPKEPWPATQIITYKPNPHMSSQLQPAIKHVHSLHPVSARRVLAPGYTKMEGDASFAQPPRWTFDFGQEFSGHVHLQFPMVPAVTNFTLSHGEVLSHPPLKVQNEGTTTGETADYDGSVYMGNIFWANQTDIFQSGNSAGAISYQPRFTYHGFRYVELSIDPPLPAELAVNVTVENVVGINVRTAAREQTHLTIANPLLQKLHSNSWWTEASGLMGIPNGAAARGERAGWTGDAAFASESEAVDFDTAAFFAQYLQQLDDLSCHADGTLDNCVPNTDPRRDTLSAQNDPDTCSDLTSDPSWSTVLPTTAWNMWRYYGATNVIQKHYPKLQQYMATLGSRANKSGLANMRCAFGDWNPVVTTPCQITAALSYLHDLSRMVDIAEALGHTADVTMYAGRLKSWTQQFHAAFWNPATQTYSSGSQMALVSALWLGAVPASLQPEVLSSLVQDVNNRGLTVGFLGVRYMFEVLVRYNHTTSAIQCLLRTSYPGYGHEIYNVYEPGTSLWESWSGDFMGQWMAESSRSHHYQASINTFLRKYVVGLDMPDGVSAWAVVKARPEAALVDLSLAAELPAAAATIATHRGLIGVSWARSGGGELLLNVTVPGGSAGEVHVPKTAGASTLVSEGGTVVWRAGGGFVKGAVDGVTGAEDGGRFIVFTTLSGYYSFAARREHADDEYVI